MRKLERTDKQEETIQDSIILRAGIYRGGGVLWVLDDHVVAWVFGVPNVAIG
jgi:hypothetical protein